jgi:hypothetical protein
MRRDQFCSRRQRFLQALPQATRAQLDALQNEPRDDSQGKVPGSEREDEEERLFCALLPEEERACLEGHKGLGNSQKAEVAWLEKMGYAYEEVDVRHFGKNARKQSAAARKQSAAARKQSAAARTQRTAAAGGRPKPPSAAAGL